MAGAMPSTNSERGRPREGRADRPMLQSVSTSCTTSLVKVLSSLGGPTPPSLAG